MEDNPRHRKMREQYQVSIRREKIQQIFRQERKRMQQHLIIYEQKEMEQELSTHQLKSNWILKKSRQLTGFPNSSWRSIIRQLLGGARYFKPNYDQWIKADIIKNLCQVFEFEYVQLSLMPLVATLFSHLINYELADAKQEDDKRSNICSQILQQEILRDLSQHTYNQNTSLNQICDYFVLINNIFQCERNPVIKCGAFKSLIMWSKRVVAEPHVNKQYTRQILYFCSTLVQSDTLRYNYSLCIIGLVADFLNLALSDDILFHLLVILYHIVKNGKEALYTQFFSSSIIMKRLFECTTHKDQSLRRVVWFILSFLSSSEKEGVGEILENYGIFQHIINVCQLQSQNEFYNYKLKKQIINILSNMSAQSNIYRDKIANSDFLTIILDGTHKQNPLSLKQSAFYCIHTLVLTKDYNIHKRLIFDTNILECLMLILIQKEGNSSKLIIQILNIIIKLVEVDTGVFREEGNVVLNILDSRYNFQNILENIYNRFKGKMSQIQLLIDKIFDLYSA